MIKKIILLFSILFISTSLYANPNIVAKTAIVVDYHSDEILYEYDPDMSIYPASMTKIMTSIIAFDLLKQGKIKLDDKFLVSEKAWRMSQAGYSSMFIMVNDEISVENLLRGIIVASGNDSCVALAEGIAGSEENFVLLMNAKAAEIGMTATKFDNSSGLNSPENYSTVRDIALMSKYLIKNYPEFYHYYAEKEFTWDRTGGDPITQANRNLLVGRNLGVDGIKTGHLAVEQYSLASSLKKNKRRIIAVGSGFKTMATRSSHSFRLLNWGLRNFDTLEVAEKGVTEYNLKTWLGKTETVKAVANDDAYVTISKKDVRDYRAELSYEGPIKAPIKKGQEVGKINVYIKDNLIKSVKLYANEDVKKVNFIKSIFLSLNYLIWGDV